ncbi:putative 5-nitroimidazole antibiotic resistance [Salmonella enterica subsp. enterica serovar Alachua str. R6-377]|nr:putative 5-nitroimidazole antibiotic resistance [Salmonella enterica subsp. enterica serovar Alachua str. R6-377]
MRYGLDVIMRQTDPGKTFSYREDMMKAVCVVRIECDALTCRRHLATQSE